MKLLVLDGNSILNRAFYGIKLLTTKDGRYTNGIVGFLNILLSLRELCQPDAVAIAFDVKAPTFRHGMYEHYKAQRKGMPPELAAQLPPLKELLTAMGLPLIEAPGWEADDILGTLAASGCGEDSCVLATGDRDSLQLVDGCVEVLLAGTKGGRPVTTRYTPEAVMEEYGVTPAQLIDVKALMGDASDNIPGVAGIGQKTAQALIARFDSLENLYERLDDPDIRPALRLKLEQGREDAFLSKALGTIRRDVPIPTAYQSYLPQAANAAKATSLLAELEMFAMIERLRLPAAPLGEGGAPEASVPVRVVDEMDFDALLARCRAAGKACFLPVFQDALLEALLFAEEGRVTRCACGHLGFPGFCKALLEDEKVAVYSADVKQLHRWCAQNGIRFSNAAMDTTLAGYLLNPNASGYAPGRLAREYGISLPAGGDDTVRAAAALPELCAVLEQELEKNQQTALMREIELPLARVLAAMELRGVPVLAARIEAFGDELSKRVNELLDEIYGCAGYIFNVNSPKQLGDVLFLKLGLRPPKKTKTGYSTNAEVLESLREEHPLIPLVLEYRTLSKLKSTYCEGLLKVIESYGRVRSSLNQTETRTGRISSSEP
ncbi:MAG: DNA polymerase, partial [Oscillospiraceae bacterium]|nr:DNA polymerase [Oscillospiraceae bacterium]